ncbi:hypothetical protein GQ53DRAFT_765072 [Thozetella sp. PMI_491]|nr:hypothetical protein GQ53DRAFT_765072 [Thozetella sp. PMI_491]
MMVERVLAERVLVDEADPVLETSGVVIPDEEMDEREADGRDSDGKDSDGKDSDGRESVGKAMDGTVTDVDVGVADGIPFIIDPMLDTIEAMRIVTRKVENCGIVSWNSRIEEKSWVKTVVLRTVICVE